MLHELWIVDAGDFTPRKPPGVAIAWEVYHAGNSIAYNVEDLIYMKEYQNYMCSY